MTIHMLTVTGLRYMHDGTPHVGHRSMEVRSKVELRVAALWRSIREANKTTSIRTQVILAVVVGFNQNLLIHYSSITSLVRWCVHGRKVVQ
jgi:hypothetical protein